MSSVIVVGAGPTGLTLAIDLLGAGVAVRLLDGAAGPATTSRALGLQPRGLEVLERAGALGELAGRSNPIGQVQVDLGSGRPARLRLGQVTELVTRPGLLVSQAEVEATLRRRLAELGGAVEWQARVRSVRQDCDGVDVEDGAGTVLRADWLVGCDGAHSTVRTAAGLAFPGVPVIERFTLADVHADLPLARDTVAVWLRGEHMLAAFPLPGPDLWRLMAPAPDDCDLDGPAVLELLRSQLAERTGLPASVVRGAEWTSTFRIHRRLVERYRQGRILLAGDAAHIHSPVGGQGMNTGIGDAENLAWKLALVAAGRAGPRLLDSYQAERRPVAEEVLDSTTGLTRVVLGRNRTARLLRDRVLVPALNRPRVQRLIWERASQLTLSYAGGPLGTAAARLARRPRPGDRIPDLACRRPGGASTRLYAELGSRWALLVPARQDGRAWLSTARHRLGTDTVGLLTPDGGTAPDVLLVRPDGHLGWRGSGDPDRLDRWLAGILQ